MSMVSIFFVEFGRGPLSTTTGFPSVTLAGSDEKLLIKNDLNGAPGEIRTPGLLIVVRFWPLCTGMRRSAIVCINALFTIDMW